MFSPDWVSVSIAGIGLVFSIMVAMIAYGRLNQRVDNLEQRVTEQENTQKTILSQIATIDKNVAVFIAGFDGWRKLSESDNKHIQKELERLISIVEKNAK